MKFKTCTFVNDTGYLCQSAAVGGREYCCYHLRHLGRQMRRAKQRARGERFDLHLPPLENMHAVQSALSQVVEALAADMIDPKPAHQLLLALRRAATNFRHPEAWRASAYLNDQSAAFPASYEEFEADYGLPEGLDLSTPPEVAFPLPNLQRRKGALPLSASRADRVGTDGPPTKLATSSTSLPCPPSPIAKTGPAAPSTPFGPTSPCLRKTSRSTRSARPRAAMPLPVAAINCRAIASAGSSTLTASASPPSPSGATCASPPSDWPQKNWQPRIPPPKKRPRRAARSPRF